MDVHLDIRRLTIALLAVLLAFAVRLTLRPVIGEASPFLLFAPAVMIAAFAAALIAFIIISVRRVAPKKAGIDPLDFQKQFKI